MQNRFPRTAVAFRLSLSLSLGLAGTASAQNYALTEDAPTQLYHAQITADGQRVVYSGREPGFAYELFSVSLAGGSAPVGLDMGIGAPDFLVTPDSSRALHRVGGGLVSSPLDGSTAIPLHALTGPGDVGAYLVSPDNNWVVFEARPTGGVRSLLGVPLDGSQPATDLFTGPLLADFKIAPDSARVLYRFALPGGNPYDLYSIPIDGSSGAVSLSSMIPQGFNDVYLYEITPDGSRVVFSTEDNTLNSIAVDGVPGNDLRIGGIWSTFLTFELSSDGASVVYMDGGHASSAPVDGGSAPISLDGPLTPYFGSVDFATLSPDAGTVIYASDVRSPNRFELYSVPTDGSRAPVRLSGSIVSGGTVVFDWAPPVVSPDSTTVVYLADQEVDQRFELYSVPIDGSAAPARLNAELAPNGDVAFTNLGFQIRNGFRISPDSLRVAYIADEVIDERFELFSVALHGGSSRRVNGPLISGGDVTISGYKFDFSPDGRRILYGADQEVDEDTQLYATVIAPGLTRVRPDLGPSEGANLVTLHGSGFTAETTVTFGGTYALAVTFLSPTELLVQAPATDATLTSTNPPFTPGARRKTLRVPSAAVDITVSDGISSSTLVGGYRYVRLTNR